MPTKAQLFDEIDKCHGTLAQTERDLAECEAAYQILHADYDNLLAECMETRVNLKRKCRLVEEYAMDLAKSEQKRVVAELKLREVNTPKELEPVYFKRDDQGDPVPVFAYEKVAGMVKAKNWQERLAEWLTR